MYQDRLKVEDEISEKAGRKINAGCIQHKIKNPFQKAGTFVSYGKVFHQAEDFAFFSCLSATHRNPVSAMQCSCDARGGRC